MRVPFAKHGLAGLIAMVLTLAIVGPASAASPHVFKGSIGSTELSLTEQSGVAVDQDNGHVYVADTGNDRIAEYSESGTLLGDFASLTEPTFLAIERSSGDVYVVNSGGETITKLSSAGVPVASWGNAATPGSMGGFGEIAGIAVDHSGNLFVLGLDGELHELSSAGAPSGAPCDVPYQTASSHVAPNGIAVDSVEDVYFAIINVKPFLGPGFEKGAKISSSCEGISREFGRPTAGFAINEADDSVFESFGPASIEFSSDKGKEVSHYSSGGDLLEEFGLGEGHLEEARQLAVRSSNEAVYVADAGKQYVAIFEREAVEPPEVIFEEPGGVTEVTGTTAHFKAEINPKGSETTYRFECIPNCRFGTKEGLEEKKTLPVGSGFETVEAVAEKLNPGAEYKVYITAENPGGVTRAPEEPDEGLSFTTGAGAPSIEEEAVTEVSETAATVAAVINPGGAETHYRVEYVTRAQFEASEFAGAAQTPEPEATLAIGGQGVPVSVGLTNLGASTAYVARVVATNAIEAVPGEPIFFITRGRSLMPVTGTCPNEIFRTEESAMLPDCRAYEQSTPVDKSGGGVAAVPGAVQATEGPAGEGAITYYTQAGIPGGVGAQDYPTFISSRGEGAWSTQGLLPPQAYGRKAVYLGLIPGGRFALSAALGSGPNGENLGAGLFRRDLRRGALRTIVPYDPECPSISFECFVVVGGTADGSRIFFESALPLTEETPAGQRNVFLWEESSGEVSLVDVDEAGVPLPEGGYAGPFDWPQEDLAQGGSRGYFYVSAVNAVSPGRGQVIFTEAQEEEGSEKGHGQIYVRKGLGGPSPTSLKVSAYREGRSGKEFPAAFLEATPHGRYVFFKSRMALTGDSYMGEPGHESESLYRYDVATNSLVDLTPDPAEELDDGPGVEGILGTSESGRVAYFVAEAELTGETGPTGETAVAGQPNLYRWEEGGPLRFVARLQGGQLEEGEGDTRDWSPAAMSHGQRSLTKTARVSADGGSVVFSSVRALTGAPNRAPSCSGSGCAEFFRYAAPTGTLDCISCDPTGARPIGAATIGTGYIEASDSPEYKAAPVLSRNLSADGDRFFFQTPNPLVAADRNSVGCSFGAINPSQEQASCMDVYEWEAPGSGTCTNAIVDGGCLYLISSGDSDQPSYFADADREGENVYFFTSSQLVPADGDQLYDAYDARERGGLASQHPVRSLPCSSRQDCQGPQVGAGAAGTPGSSTFQGPGNPKAPKCKKGFVRRHGKCVKKVKHGKKHHRKHHKKKVHKGKGQKKKHTGNASAERRAGHDRGGKK